MAQAKTLTPAEFDRALRYISKSKFALRNKTMFLVSHWSGMRVKEIAGLTVQHVTHPDGTAKAEVRLTPEQTKGRHARTVYLPQKLQDEIAYFLRHRCINDPSEPLFFTANACAFSANTLCQYFFWMYRNAGISGASSHSGRKSFLTNLANQGVSIHVLASLAGHRSIAVTNRYLTANDDMKRRAVELV